MTKSEYLQLVEKAKQGILTEEELEALRNEALSRSNEDFSKSTH